MPPDMPAAKLRPVEPEHHHAAAGHVLAAVIADALDDRGRAGVAHAEALADHTADERFARRGAVQHDVAGDDVVLGGERRVAVRPDDHPTARQALGRVVVGVALEPQRDAPRQERAEALAGRAAQVDVDGVVGQALAAVAPRDLRAEQRADAAVDVADRQLDLDRPADLERRLRPAR